MPRRLIAASAALLFAAATAAAVTGSAHAADPASGPTTRAICSTNTTWQCRAEMVVGKQAGRVLDPRSKRASSSVYTAANLQSLYRTRHVSPAGGRPTIAIVDAFHYRHAASDLAHYRRTMGLPACTVASRCLRIVNQSLRSSPLPSTPPTHDDWTLESALDLQAASAICPRCRLVLVEASNDNGAGLIKGARNARKIAHYVSMSWGSPDNGSVPAGTFTSANTIYTAATGDSGYSSRADTPSTLSDVVAVGGVSVPKDGSAATAWSGAGSSCSRRIPTPGPQAALNTGCAHKAGSDISATADAQYGIAVYDSDAQGGAGWYQMGGTSAATPIVAALYAIAGNHTDPWAAYRQRKVYPGLLRDLTTGTNGFCGAPMCRAGIGWDGPTGIGMPRSPEAVALPLARMRTHTTPLRGVRRHRLTKVIAIPRTVPDTRGTAQRLKASTAHITGLPRGLHAHLVHHTLRITGRPSQAGSGTARITLTGRTPAGRKASGRYLLGWTIRR